MVFQIFESLHLMDLEYLVYLLFVFHRLNGLQSTDESLMTIHTRVFSNKRIFTVQLSEEILFVVRFDFITYIEEILSFGLLLVSFDEF
jgi:hypothetical protein